MPVWGLWLEVREARRRNRVPSPLWVTLESHHISVSLLDKFHMIDYFGGVDYGFLRIHCCQS